MDQQQIETATKLLPAFVPLIRVTAQEKMNERAMTRRKDAEIEMIEAKKSAAGSRDVFGAVAEAKADPDPEPEQTVVQQERDEFADSVDRMIANEDCDLCATLLEGIKDVDPSDRAVALSQFGRFKQSTDDAADAAEVRDEIEGMSVLREVMVREFNMAPS